MSEVRVLGFAGRKGAGKSTAAAAIAAAVAEAGRLDFADPLKGMLAAFGLSDAQLYGDAKEKPLDWLDVTPRRLMQTLGTEWGRELIHPDLWVRLWELRALDALRSRAPVVLVADVRFVNELAAVRRLGGRVAWVGRPGVAPPEHVSEQSMVPAYCDGYLANFGGLLELQQIALTFARECGAMN